MSEIGLFEAMYSARALRRLKPDPVPDEIITQVLDAAIRAPSAGNSQHWVFIVVRDPEVRHKLAVIYRKASDIAKAIYQARGRPAHMTDQQYQRMMSSGAYLWEHMGDAPVLLVPCLYDRPAPPREMLPPEVQAVYEQELVYTDRIRGASIYPAVQNIILACRAFGLGTLITTNHIRCEDEVKALLKITGQRVDLCADAHRLSRGQVRPAQAPADERSSFCRSLGHCLGHVITATASDPGVVRHLKPSVRADADSHKPRTQHPTNFVTGFSTSGR